MDEEKIDLSGIDPSRDRQRWEGLVQALASRAHAARQRQLSVGHQLLAWARPALAIAASVALMSWAGRLVSPEQDAAVTEGEQDPAIVLAQWAMNDERPPANTILRVLGEPHAAD
jgi:hypothetical protein